MNTWLKDGLYKINSIYYSSGTYLLNDFAVCLSSHLLDPAVDDFVLMHCVFMPNTQLCPLLMAQYPFCLYFAVFHLFKSHANIPVLFLEVLKQQLSAQH